MDIKELKEELVYQFCSQIIQGLENKINVMLKENQISLDQCMLISTELLEYYMTQLYKAILENKDEDQKVIEIIEQLSICEETDKLNELNILSRTLMNVYPKFPRSKLDHSDKENHSKSLEGILVLMKKFIIFSYHKEIEYVKSIKPAEDDNLS